MVQKSVSWNRIVRENKELNTIQSSMTEPTTKQSEIDTKLSMTSEVNKVMFLITSTDCCSDKNSAFDDSWSDDKPAIRQHQLYLHFLSACYHVLDVQRFRMSLNWSKYQLNGLSWAGQQPGYSSFGTWTTGRHRWYFMYGYRATGCIKLEHTSPQRQNKAEPSNLGPENI